MKVRPPRVRGSATSIAPWSIMTDSHRIRLRGPWQCEPLPGGTTPERSDGVSPASRVQFPAAWETVVSRDYCGCVRFRRHFHRPDGLDADETVWLMTAGIDTLVGLTLNGRPIPFPAAEVTAELQDYNELVIDVERRTAGLGPIGEVWLEIRGPKLDP